MKRNPILLSTGMIPWMELQDAVSFARENGYDGIELLPTRKICKTTDHFKNTSELRYIFGIHQSWRLDMKQDRRYGISALIIPFFTILRLIFFPKVSVSQQVIFNLSKKTNLPITVHGISSKWTKCDKQEFEGGVALEIFNMTTKKERVKKWLKKDNHSLVFDARDDQSLSWAKKQGFKGWKDMWQWFGLNSISNIQLTLIGKGGLRKILEKKSPLAEQQFLWLHKNKWHGSVTVEANPLILFLQTKGNTKMGLQMITKFIKTTLIKGEPWSTS